MKLLQHILHLIKLLMLLIQMLKPHKLEHKLHLKKFQLINMLLN